MTKARKQINDFYICAGFQLLLIMMRFYWPHQSTETILIEEMLNKLDSAVEKIEIQIEEKVKSDLKKFINNETIHM